MEAAELFPEEPIDRIVRPFARFLHVQAAGGIVLLLTTLVALVLANSTWSSAFLGFWETEVAIQVGSFHFEHSLKHLINDGLMVLFFFVIGLEVKREMVLGELRDLRQAALPMVAALGGMLAPAAIYLALQWGQPGQHGWGIPMATDIAFVVGCMLILGDRVPHGLRVMLLSLAIADDIGAILVIAIGYSHGLHWGWLAIGVLDIAVVAFFARLGVRSMAVYTVIGFFTWYAFLESGVHATIAGVILGLMTPARTYLDKGLLARMLDRAGDVFHGEYETSHRRVEKVRRMQMAVRETVSPLEYLESTLHPWVSFVIMPIFALANAGVAIDMSSMGSSVGIAVMLGLVVGKPLGIVSASYLCVKTGLAKLPANVTWGMVVAGSCLAGIGFTMALFIADLALGKDVLDVAKIGVLLGSLICAVLGMLLLVTFTSSAKSRNT